MPKMKTKSSVKGRFKKVTKKVNGRKVVTIKCGQAGKRHGMTKRSKKFIRNQRGTTTLCAADARIVVKYMPN